MPGTRVFGSCTAARGVFLVLILMAAPAYVYAQTGGQTGGSGGTRKSAPAGSTTQVEPSFQQERRTMLVSGRVVLDDGTAPPERVAIERVCAGRTRHEAHTDSQGQFNFQMGSAVQTFQDASVGTLDMAANSGRGAASMSSPSGMSGMGNEGITDTELMGCELRASLPGYYSDSISLTGRRHLNHPDVGTLVLHRLGKVEGTRISAVSSQAPRQAKKAMERGQTLLKQKDTAGAAEEMRKAIAAYPKYAEAQLALSAIYAEQGRKQEANRLLEQAIESDPNFLPPYIVLARVEGDQGNWSRMAELSERALALNPYEFPVVHFYYAIANYNLQKFDVAEKSARTARRLDSQYRIPRIDFLLANLLSQRQDYAAAADQLRSFLQHGPAASEAQMARDLLSQFESKLAETKK